jgi:hypothetical protein
MNLAIRAVVVGPADPTTRPGMAGEGPTAYNIRPSSGTGSALRAAMAVASRAADASRKVSTGPVRVTRSPADNAANRPDVNGARRSSATVLIDRLSCHFNVQSAMCDLRM